MLEANRQSGAYAIVRDRSERVLVVRAQNGRFYLPGGRIEPGEDARTALAREIEEECGWTATVGASLGQARHRIIAGTIELEATYWHARLIVPRGGAEHELLWLEPAAAARLLHRAGDRAIMASAAEERLESAA